jgi:D-3-phosphoglycerate dehydrogenase
MSSGSDAESEVRQVTDLIAYCGPIEAVDALEAALERRAELIIVAPERRKLEAALTRAAAYLDASMKLRVDASLLDCGPDLRVIAVAATGTDHVDRRALHDRSIALLTLRDHPAVLRDLTPAAEHSWLLLMACARQLTAACDDVLLGNWNRLDFPGIMLNGRTIGIIGCGRIGTLMARYATAFGMRCLGYDPDVAMWPGSIQPVELRELLEAADFVTVHVPLSVTTIGLIDAEAFARMKRGVVFINTSRGAVVDELALLDAMERGQVAAAGLDVLTGEPDVAANPLRQFALDHRRLLITPHVAGFSPDAVRIAVAHMGLEILKHMPRVT